MGYFQWEDMHLSLCITSAFAYEIYCLDEVEHDIWYNFILIF